MKKVHLNNQSGYSNTVNNIVDNNLMIYRALFTYADQQKNIPESGPVYDFFKLEPMKEMRPTTSVQI